MSKPTAIHAFGNDVLAAYDAVALAAMVQRGEVSSLELVEAAIARAEQVNPAIQAIELKDYSQARRQANEPIEGIFAGVPSFIKDNTNIAQWPTRHGSRATPSTPAKKNGTFAEQFLSLGLVLLGKSRLPEFGFNCTTEFAEDPPARNPWNTDYSCGGSSGGAAALVAAGVVPVAHANDGGGSIRIPAACCGLVGLKPSRSRFVTHEMAKSLPVQIVCDGIVSRTVRDTAYFVAGAERFWTNKRLPEVGLVEGPSNRRLKVGLLTESVSEQQTCAQTQMAVTRIAAVLERAGHQVSEYRPTNLDRFADDFANYWGFLAFMARRLGKLEFGRQFDSSKLDNFSTGLAGLFTQRWRKTPASILRLSRTWKRSETVFNEFDVVLSPVVGHITPKLGFLGPNVPFDQLIERLYGYAKYTPLNNADGTPAISIPAGLSEEGLPIGVQLASRYGDERTLLELAFEIEHLAPWSTLANAPTVSAGSLAACDQ